MRWRARRYSIARAEGEASLCLVHTPTSSPLWLGSAHVVRGRARWSGHCAARQSQVASQALVDTKAYMCAIERVMTCKNVVWISNDASRHGNKGENYQVSIVWDAESECSAVTQPWVPLQTHWPRLLAMVVAVNDEALVDVAQQLCLPALGLAIGHVLQQLSSRAFDCHRCAAAPSASPSVVTRFGCKDHVMGDLTGRIEEHPERRGHLVSAWAFG